jgi:4-oxalocrotonate tautomerase
MPYIKIKAYPKDEAVKARVAERIHHVFLEEWGCPSEAISLSFEEVSPELWENQVDRPEVEANRERMHIYHGQKKY